MVSKLLFVSAAPRSSWRILRSCALSPASENVGFIGDIYIIKLLSDIKPYMRLYAAKEVGTYQARVS